jgi:hypothetical protein
VAEFPKLRATVRADGTYDLAVPNRARVTPYIQAAGHHTIYLQTFATAGEDLANVNFQTPSTPIYMALVTLLGVPVDADGDPVRCAIVSTFNTRNVRDLATPASSPTAPMASPARRRPPRRRSPSPCTSTPASFPTGTRPRPRRAGRASSCGRCGLGAFRRTP